jgi:hypothetical protein
MLTADEQKLVYNIEVMGMTQLRAAQLCGLETTYANILMRPEVKIAREKLRAHVREQVKITREDVVAGLQEAIEMSRMITDPMAMIAAWRETAKILGFDKPAEVHITITGDIRELRQQIKSLPEAELLRLADESNIVDADFYPIERTA